MPVEIATLNGPQAEAVQCTEGPLLVLAGAGSGKTRVLTYRIAHLVEDLDVAPWEILAITFTNKAAAEMRERLQGIIGPRCRGMWVSTFHSMCVRMLRADAERLGFSKSFTIYDTDDQKRLYKEIMAELDIDPKRIEMGWVMDFCAQGLRNIIIGIGGRLDGFMMESKFGIAVGSELMAILAVARDLKDLRERIGKIVVAYSRSGEPVTCDDLEVAGAMTAWMRNTINPTMCYSVEHQPVLVHAGPFANIAIGQSSVIADRLALKLFDYHVTESGFAADIGFEKFWNVKTRLSGLTPNVSVLVATVRALKMHGGGPKVTPGAPLPKEYTEENLELLEKGTCNLFHHVNTIKKSGINPVVCINRFYTDTDAEIALLKKLCKEHGVRCAESNHWRYGGEGAIELAKAVVEACEEPVNIKFLYDLDMPLRQRVELIAKEVYGADGVDWAPLATQKAERFESDPKYKDYCTMMVKTHLSLSDDPTKKGVPTGWRLAIRDILEYGGAKFLCPMAGTISMMPGTAANPAYRRIDVDTETGKVSGLF